MSEIEQPYIIVEKRGSGFAAFVWGAVVGAAAALLLAPKSGEETQQDLREGARRFKEGANEKISELRGSLEDSYEHAREEVDDRVAAVRRGVRDRQRRAEEALKAGKEAAKRARTDLEERVAESKAAYKAAISEPESENGQSADDADDED
jgi:gas vesicle protein